MTEDVNEGPVVAGLSTRLARSAQELRTLYNAGRASRDACVMDLGSVHERSTAIFTVTLAQYAPAALHGEEDRIMVRVSVDKHASRVHVVWARRQA